MRRTNILPFIYQSHSAQSVSLVSEVKVAQPCLSLVDSGNIQSSTPAEQLVSSVFEQKANFTVAAVCFLLDLCMSLLLYSFTVHFKVIYIFFAQPD